MTTFMSASDIGISPTSSLQGFNSSIGHVFSSVYATRSRDQIHTSYIRIRQIHTSRMSMEIETEMRTYSDRIEQLRQRLGVRVRKEHDDRALYKWLKARNFEVDAAEEMYHKSLEWRREIGADTILRDYTQPEVMRKYYPGGLFGVAKDGCPVWVEPQGRGDLRGILCSVPRDEIIKSMVYRMELLYARFRELSEEHGRPIDQCVHIIDVEGYGPKQLWKPVLDMYVAILNVLENNYPETLQASYIINCPRFFRVGFDFLRRFIDSQTANKIIILDYNWKDTLRALIADDQLPAIYGGTRVDSSGDPMCSQLICCGGEVPKHYYMGRMNTFLDGKTLTQETIGRRRTFSAEFDTFGESAALRWGFSTTSGSIWFTVRFRPSSQSNPDCASSDTDPVMETIVLQPPTKYNCSTHPADGLVMCDELGQYIVEFFNASFLFTRSLSYCIHLVVQDDDQLWTIERDARPATVTRDGILAPGIADDDEDSGGSRSNSADPSPVSSEEIQF